MITVNDVVISEQAVLAEMQHHPARSAEAAQERAARALVVRELLVQEARRQGITPEEARGDGDPREADDEAMIRCLLEREITVPDADETVCRRYYENNRTRFRGPALFEAAHILIQADPEDEGAMAEARQSAERLIGILTEAPHRFSDLAADVSGCDTGKQGGHLGQVTEGELVPEVESFLKVLEPGQLSPVPVPSPYGYHVLRLDKRLDGNILPFETVHEKIADYLRLQTWQRAVHQYIKILAGKAEIDGIAFEQAESPLVQ